MITLYHYTSLKGAKGIFGQKDPIQTRVNVLIAGGAKIRISEDTPHGKGIYLTSRQPPSEISKKSLHKLRTHLGITRAAYKTECVIIMAFNNLRQKNLKLNKTTTVKIKKGLGRSNIKSFKDGGDKIVWNPIGDDSDDTHIKVLSDYQGNDMKLLDFRIL